MPAPGRYPEWKETDQARGLRAVSRAVARGDLAPVKTVQCCHCMRRNAQTYHHPNGYDDDHLLDVIPLCYKCHSAEHKRIGWYNGKLTPFIMPEVCKDFFGGMPIKQLVVKYRATATVIRSAVKQHCQPRLLKEH